MYTIQTGFRTVLQPRPFKSLQILYFFSQQPPPTPHILMRNNLSVWRVMIYRRFRFGRSSAIILFATTIFCVDPRSIAAQDFEAKPAPADHKDNTPASKL